MIRGVILISWGWMMIWSLPSGRVNVLVRGIFHNLIGFGGLTILTIGILLLFKKYKSRERFSWKLLFSGLIAILIILNPPNPSLSDLANNRPQELKKSQELAFLLPPGQRTLTDWVRLLRNQPDPYLIDGNPINISGFVWQRSDGSHQIARLTVRCCLADATPSGLEVEWPTDVVLKANEWLSIKGNMSVIKKNGIPTSVIVPESIKSIPRPIRPFEP